MQNLVRNPAADRTGTSLFFHIDHPYGHSDFSVALSFEFVLIADDGDVWCDDDLFRAKVFGKQS